MKNFLIIISCILFINTSIFSQITSSPANQVCQGSTMTFTYIGSVPNNATYSWSFTGGQPNITTSSAVSPSVQFNLAGICLVQLTINQGLNSQNIIPPISVQILGSQPSISVNNTNSNYCVGSAITPITYTISGGASPTLSSGSLNGLTSTSTQNTSLGFISGYTFTISGTPTSSGCLTAIYSSSALGSCSGSSPASFNLSSICVNSKPTVTSISYGSPSFCTTNNGSQSVSLIGSDGTIYSGGSPSVWPLNSGTYSSTTGLSINTSTGAITPSTSTPGTYQVQYTIAAANGCSQVIASTQVIITATPTATINYSGSPFCSLLTSAQGVSLNGTNNYTGGTYSSTTGLSINASTGAISSSTAGAYTVTYTIAASGGCLAVSTTASVTITALPSATISYTGSPFCNTLSSTQSVTQTGTTGGTYSSTTGLTINASTGAITPSTSTAGTYTVTYTIAASGGCAAVSTTASVTITALPTASIIYAGSPFCSSLTSGVVTLTGTGIFTAGSYSSTSGLTINGSSGLINPSTSSAGTYTVTYTTLASGGCAAVSTTASVTITALPSATISYTGSLFCNTLSSPQSVTQTGTIGGTYSSTSGLSLNTSTGAITPSISTAGTYTVTYTIAASGGCAAVSTTASVTITTLPSPNISYAGSPFCSSLTSGVVLLGGTGIITSGTYTSSPGGLALNTISGGINPSTSTAGTYTVTYTIAATGGCSAVSTTASVTITTLPSATLSYTSTSFCQTLASPQIPNQTGATNGLYTASALVLSIDNTTGAILPSASSAGTYTVTYTIPALNGCAAVLVPTTVTITALPTASIIYAGSPFCSSLTSGAVTLTGTGIFTGGSYSSTSGLTINGGTGLINPSLSIPGSYTVTYTTLASGGCLTVSTTTSVTITALPSATISYTGSPFCNTLSITQSVSQTGSTGGTYSSTTGLTINASTGAITPSASSAGTYTVTYTIPALNGCAAVLVPTTVTITALPTASIIYAGSPFCSSVTSGVVTLTGTGIFTGGNYSSTSGLTINGSTGLINPSTSIPGTYTITYNTPASGGCAAVIATNSVTITAAPTATIIYTSSPFCNSITSAQSVNLVGTTGGTFSSTTGLSINASTGAITPSSSTAGTYTVTYTIPALNGCTALVTTSSVTITAVPTATINYSGSPFCSSLTSGVVTLTGTGIFTGGNYSSTSGLTINGSTGLINPSLSIPGLYTVTYTTLASGGCLAVIATYSVTITAAPTASISYSSPFCSSSSTPQNVNLIGTTGGIYSSSPSGLSLNTSTGAITPSVSTAGTYTVTYTIAAAGGCASVTATSQVIITVAPAATINYLGSPFCKTITSAQSVNQTGASGGSYSSNPSGLSLNTSTGAITPNTSTAGIYTVSYTIPTSGGCPQFQTQTNVTITAAPTATITYANTPFCSTIIAAQSVQLIGNTGGAYASTSGLIINPITGEINPSTSTVGTYTVTYTIAAAGGCAAFSTNTTVTIASPTIPTFAQFGPFCQNLVNPGILPTSSTNSTPILGSWNPTTINTSLVGITNYTFTPTASVFPTCATSTQISITINSPTIPTFSQLGQYCQNQVPGTLQSTSSNNISGTWIPATISTALPGTSTYTFNPTSTAAPTCAVSTPMNITTNPPTIPSFSPLTYCQNNVPGILQPVSLNGISGTWSPATISTAIIGNTNYTFNPTTTAAPTCAVTTQLSVSTNSNPSPTIVSSSPNNSACFGGIVTLTVGNITPLNSCTYEWFLNSVSVGTGNSYAAGISGSYEVKALNIATGCFSNSAQVTVTIHPNIPVSIIIPSSSSTTFCEGTTSITLTASPQIGYTYVWSNGLTSPTINLSLANQSASYTVTVTNSVTNCSATSTPMPITVYPNPSAPTISPIGPLTSCAGNPLLTLTASPNNFPTYQWKNGIVNVGSNSPSHNPASTGAYSVIATNSNGCSSLPSNSTFITINPTPATPVIIPQTGSPLTFCQGGSINLSATINSGSTYQWLRNGIPYISGNPVNITLSGTYTLIETNSVGCSSQTSNPLTITVNPNPTPVITANGPITFCANPGASVTLQATPGSNLYQWTCVSPSLPTQAASSSPNFIATQTGTYTVTTTNSNGCISAVSNSIQVVVNPIPIVTITNNSPTTFCQGGNVIITANPGPVGYTYLWNTINGTPITNSSSQANTILSSGSYSVKVTNLTTQCFATSSTITITVNPLPSPTITMIAPTPLCQGNTATLTANSNGTGLVYSWSPNFATTNPINVTSSGNFSVTVTDNNGCVGVSPIQTVIVNPNPAAFITPSSLPTLLCQGDTVTLQSSPSSFNYQWIQYNSINGQPSIISTGNQNLPVTNSGTYTVTNYNPSGCFTISDPITVTVNPLPTPSIIANGPTTFCQGSSVFINATGVGITTYQWKVNGQNIPGATSSSYTATSTGSYTVEVVNNNNCSNISSSINVTVNQNPSANITYTWPTPPPILLCPGTGIGLTASPSNMNYIWNSSSNIGIQTNQYLLANTTGSYTVNVTDPLTGCSSVSLPLDVTIIQQGTTPAAVIGMPNVLSPLCPNSTISLSGITTNATSYNWTQTSGPLGNLIGANTLNPSFTSGFSSGIVILTLNTTLDYACNSVSSSQSITITVNPSIPTLSHDTISGPIDQVLCSNIPITPIIFNVLNIPGSGTTVPSVIIDGTSVLANTVYNGISWSFINGFVTISGTPNFGTYTYTVKGIPSGSTSCISDSITGTINSLSPSISITSPDYTNNQVLCIGNTIDPIIYTFTGLISTSGLPPGISQQIASVGGSQTLTLSGIVSTEGYYNYAITTETYCGFETLLGEILVIPAILGNTSGSDTTTNCDGSLFTLIGGTLNSSINTNYNYLWEFSTSLTGPYTPAPGVNTNANYEGAMYLANDTLYFRRVVSAGSCSDTALPVMVQVDPQGTNPNMTGFAGPDQTISLGQSIELVTNGISVSNFDWSPIIGLNSPSISNPIASPILTTTYTLTVIDVYGCSYSDDVTVNVLNDFSLTIPSLITPNDDGSNDFWEIPESLFYTGTTVKIINREGQEVYSSSSYDNSWDGTFEGKLLPEATYYYFIQFPNSEITHKGPITILRNIK